MQSYKKTLILAALLLSGCQKSLFPGVPRYVREPSTVHGDGARAEQAEEVASSERLYITVLSGTEVLLLADGEILARSSADPDPERHRARQGHLWTDIVQGKETVVFRDGEEWLRFPGEELLMGFHFSGGKLHTLGQRPGNEGICYRIDGEAVFSAPAGRIIGSASSPEWDSGAFSADSSGLFYAYGIPFVHSGSTTWEYRIMKGPDAFQTIPDDASGTVLDLRIFQGKVYRADLSGRTLRLLCGDDILLSRRLLQAERIGNVALVPIGQEMCLKGVSTYSGYSEAWVMTGNGTDVQAALSGRTPRLFRKGPVRAAWVEKDRLIHSFTRQGNMTPIPVGRYRLSSPLCLNAFDGALYAVFSDTTGTNHLILADTTITPIHLPGTPTSIRFE